jgi:S1-C subfamily serine protease
MSVTDQVVTDPEHLPDPTFPPRAGRLRAGLIGTVAGLVLGGGLVGGLVHARTSPSTPSQPAVTAPAPVATTPGGGIDVRGVLTRVEPAVVSISANIPVGRFGRGTAAGTGMVITADGDVLTNAHVVSGADQIQVTIPNQGSHSAHLLGIDETNDVAVIKIDGVKDLPTVTLGSTKAMQVGDPVIAVGNALALDGSPTVTTGIVSALDRQIDTGTSTMSHLIQTDAAINPGNSGGPLLNSGGQVVGMNTAVAGNAQNIGFALSIDEITPKLDALKNGSTPAASSASAAAAYLGVQLQDASPGAGVATVAENSPASRAGLASGDVIIAIDGTTVNSASDLVSAIRGHKPGDQMRLVVDRDGVHQTVTATLANTPTS